MLRAHTVGAKSVASCAPATLRSKSAVATQTRTAKPALRGDFFGSTAGLSCPALHNGLNRGEAVRGRAAKADAATTHGPKLLEHPVDTPVRRGDRTNVDSFDRWAEPNWIGKLTLENWIGKEARKHSLYWPNKQELKARAPFLKDIGDTLTNRDLTYPAYYLKQFHGYNSNFAEDSVSQQAPAMAVVPAVMTKKDLDDSFNQRLLKLSGAAEAYKARQGDAWTSTKLVVDLGCGTGVSTRVLARQYPGAHVVGVDLSAPMLREAAAITEPPEGAFSTNYLEQLQLKDSTRDLAPRLTWLHDNAEGTRLEADQADLVTVHFVAHELPTEVMGNVAKEAMRLLKPGGWFAVIDNDQHAFDLHNGPEWKRRVAGIMAREPHLHEYYKEDLGEILGNNGFAKVEDVRDVKGCTLFMGQKPAE